MADNFPPFAAHFDGNQVPTMMGVVGSAGTADTQGTSKSLPVGVDASTGAAYVYNLGPAGSVTLGNTPGGTLNLVIRVGNIGTLESGTITSTLALNTGTITTIAAGTQNTLGTVGVINNGTLAQVTTVNNLTNGSVNLLTGTITSISNLAKGTIQRDQTPVNIGTTLNAIGTTGAAVWGTLVASSGNGIKQYVSGAYVVVTSGTVDVAITNIGIGGSTGAGVLARGQFVPGGGIQRTFDPNIASGTGGTIAYWLGGAGTVSLGVDYWQGA